MRRYKCEECGTTQGVEALSPCWTAGGRNCAQLVWTKHRRAWRLCEDCEEDFFRCCEGCGAYVEVGIWGTGYLPEDYSGPPLCPPCGRK